MPYCGNREGRRTSQEAVVLQNNILILGAQSTGDIDSFFRAQDETTVAVVNTQVVVEDRSILLQNVNGTTKGGPSTTAGGVAMRCGRHVGTRVMNSGVYKHD